MQTLLSKPIVDTLFAKIKAEVHQMIMNGYDPQLGVVLVGEDPDSVKYVEIKSRKAKEVGIILSLYHLEEDASPEIVQESVDFLNNDEDMSGIIVQLPLPNQFNSTQTDKLIQSIDTRKDVDGLNGAWQKETGLPVTLEGLMAYTGLALPPMVSAVVSLLDYYSIDPKGKKIVLVGGGRLVGGPLKHYFSSLKYDVQVVDENTEKILDITQQADILISGTGQKDLITYQWVKPGAVVIDCAADVHMDSVSQVAGAVAPPIGGIGPLTVGWLLHNTMQVSKKQLTQDL